VDCFKDVLLQLAQRRELVACQQRCAPDFYALTINMIAVAFENTSTLNIVTFTMIFFPGAGGSFILPDPEVYEDLSLWRPK
jgi:hypothetical protein